MHWKNTKFVGALMAAFIAGMSFAYFTVFGRPIYTWPDWTVVRSVATVLATVGTAMMVFFTFKTVYIEPKRERRALFQAFAEQLKPKPKLLRKAKIRFSEPNNVVSFTTIVGDTYNMMQPHLGYLGGDLVDFSASMSLVRNFEENWTELHQRYFNALDKLGDNYKGFRDEAHFNLEYGQLVDNIDKTVVAVESCIKILQKHGAAADNR